MTNKQFQSEFFFHFKKQNFFKKNTKKKNSKFEQKCKNKNRKKKSFGDLGGKCNMYPWYRDTQIGVGQFCSGHPVSAAIKTETGYNDCMLTFDYAASTGSFSKVSKMGFSHVKYHLIECNIRIHFGVKTPKNDIILQESVRLIHLLSEFMCSSFKLNREKKTQSLQSTGYEKLSCDFFLACFVIAATVGKVTLSVCKVA